MKRALVILILVVLVILGVVFFSRRESIAPTINDALVPSPSPSPSPTPVPTSTPGAAQPKSFTVVIANGAINPKVLTVKVGDTVTFVNNDSVPHWPAVGIHPVHNICPTFDPKRGLRTGESYAHTFTEAKTCPFHDHLNAGSSLLQGQIIVTQ